MIRGRFLWQTSKPHHAHIIWSPDEGGTQAIIGRDLPFEECKLLVNKLNSEVRYINSIIDTLEKDDDDYDD